MSESIYKWRLNDYHIINHMTNAIHYELITQRSSHQYLEFVGLSSQFIYGKRC